MIFMDIQDDEDEDDDSDEEDTGYLDFAYLTGNTTCVVDGNNNTCYSSILFNPEYINVTSAFVSCQPKNALICICTCIR